MTTFQRTPLLVKTLESISRQKTDAEVIVVDDECSERVCRVVLEHGAIYVPGRGNREWNNPAVPINKGLNQATGDIVILQNAECEHISNVIEQFRGRVREDWALFAKVKALKEDGTLSNYYTAPFLAERPYFFCGAMLRKHFIELRGMDEDYTGPGYDDDDFAVRMKKVGIRSEFADDILVDHHFHSCEGRSFTNSAEIFKRKHGMNAWWC